MKTPSVVIVTPPISPSDTNPPLGPAIVRAHLRARGIELVSVDLNARLLAEWRSGPGRNSSSAGLVGDQAKNRAEIRRMREALLSWVPSPRSGSLYPALPGRATWEGMFASFDDLDMALDECSHPFHPLRLIFDRLFFDRFQVAPDAIGISIMGPPQVLFGLLLARTARRRWPGIPVIAGGSHVTALMPEIRADARYGWDIDGFLPGHCEDELATLLAEGRPVWDLIDRGRVVRAGVADSLRFEKSRQFPVEPDFEPEELDLYEPATLAIPLQFRRGCPMRCKMCTYPAAEPVGYGSVVKCSTRESLLRLMGRYASRRFSIKDSLFTVANLKTFSEAAVGLGIEWSATTLLVEALSSEVLQKAAESGCRTLEFGLESVHHEFQRMIDKMCPIPLVERVVRDCARFGICAVINLIYGFPGESEAQARQQVAWFEALRRHYPGFVHGSHNLLEINRSSPMATSPREFGISVAGMAPWAFSAEWNHPAWVENFRPVLVGVEGDVA